MKQNLLAQAVDLHGQGRLTEAEKLYERVLAASPGLTGARHMLGVLRAQQGRNQEAFNLIAPVVAANPRDVLALANFGNVLSALHRWEEALQNFDLALALAPDYPDVWCNRANVLQDITGRFDGIASPSYEPSPSP